MMSNGITQQSLRKYLGAIKDSTTVGLAKVNSDYKELDVAIVRATNHVERPAKEKRIRAIFCAISGSRPGADMAYCIHALARRLSKTNNWAVALKTLIVIHRAMKEVGPWFSEELVSYERTRSHMLNLSYFKDGSSPYAWDYSAYVRTYALYLEERLESFRMLKCDVEINSMKTRGLETVDLLAQLPVLQQLLYRILNCQPQGAATYNHVIRLAHSLVVSESRVIYNAISEGAINIIEKFFQMQRYDAIKAFQIYRKFNQQSDLLSEFYEACKSNGIRHGEEFIKREKPPVTLLTAMEEFIKEAPRASILLKEQVKEEKTELKAVLAIEEKKTSEEQQALPLPKSTKVDTTPIMSKEANLLGTHDESPDASEMECENALALAIIPTDNLSTSNGISEWELALVENPIPNQTTAAKLAGGMDMMTLDSLYDDMLRRASQPSSYNPWEPMPAMGGLTMQQSFYNKDPFFASNSISAPYSIQIEAMAKQQHMMMMMMNQQQLHQPGVNPFGSAYAHVNPYPYGLAVPVQSSKAYDSFI